MGGKVCVTQRQVFQFEQLLYDKVDFVASKFEAALSLQIEAGGKITGRAQLIGSKTLEISFPKGTFILQALIQISQKQLIYHDVLSEKE